MDLSKAFGCLPHDLLITKLESYGFDTKTLNIFESYRNGRRIYPFNKGYGFIGVYHSNFDTLKISTSTYDMKFNLCR